MLSESMLPEHILIILFISGKILVNFSLSIDYKIVQN